MYTQYFPRLEDGRGYGLYCPVVERFVAYDDRDLTSLFRATQLFSSKVVLHPVPVKEPVHLFKSTPSYRHLIDSAGMSTPMVLLPAEVEATPLPDGYTVTELVELSRFFSYVLRATRCAQIAQSKCPIHRNEAADRFYPNIPGRDGNPSPYLSLARRIELALYLAQSEREARDKVRALLVDARVEPEGLHFYDNYHLVDRP